MNRRDFCRAGLGSLAAGAGVAVLGKAALAAEAGPGKADLSPDAMSKEAMRVYLPEKKTCSEAILAAGCKALGIESKLVPDIALGVSGGVGLQGDVCGVVTGASMVISLAIAGRETDYLKKRNLVWEHVGKFYKDFAGKHGCVECRRLSGLDLTTPEGMAALKDHVKKDTCGKLVDSAARMLGSALQEIGRMD